MQARLNHDRVELAHCEKRLLHLHPEQRLRTLKHEVRQLQQRLHGGMRRCLRQQHQRMQALVRALRAVSPLATLDRGYSIVFRAEDGTLVRDASQLAPGDALEIRLAKGVVSALVKAP
jgi:exodeoxyribonuclease VII large subunit